jgi:ATP-binding cassette, subfamily C (CFTR/MRP), member 4
MYFYKTFSDKKPPKKWPNKGRITFNNFYLRYAIDTPYVLSNLNINIEPMEKVILNNGVHF